MCLNALFLKLTFLGVLPQNPFKLAELGYTNTVRFLVDSQLVSVNQDNGFFGETALLLAVQNKRLETVKYLVSAGADSKLESRFESNSGGHDSAYSLAKEGAKTDQTYAEILQVLEAAINKPAIAAAAPAPAPSAPSDVEIVKGQDKAESQDETKEGALLGEISAYPPVNNPEEDGVHLQNSPVVSASLVLPVVVPAAGSALPVSAAQGSRGAPERVSEPA